jgi:hypothetical protein
MHHALRLLLGLAGLAAAGAAFAHAGVYPHSHPHLDLEVLLAALVGLTCGVVIARYWKRPAGK